MAKRKGEVAAGADCAFSKRCGVKSHCLGGECVVWAHTNCQSCSFASLCKNRRRDGWCVYFTPDDTLVNKICGQPVKI